MKKTVSSLKTGIWISVILLVGIILLQGTASIILQEKLNRENQNLVSHKDMVKEVEEILTSHHEWLAGMLMHVYTGDPFNGSLDYRSCSLGEWLHSDYIVNNNDGDLRALLTRIQEPHQKIHENASILVSSLENGTMSKTEADRLFIDVIKPDSLLTIEILEQIVAHQEEQALESSRYFSRLSTVVRLMNISMILTAAAAGLLIGLSLIRRVIPPVREITAVARELAKGNTDISIGIKSRDEIGRLGEAFAAMIAATTQQAELAKAVASGDLTHHLAPRSDRDSLVMALNSMTSHLQEMFEAIRLSARQVNTSAVQLAGGAQNLAEGSTEQSAAVEEMALNLDGVAAKAKDNSRTAGETAEISRHLLELAEHGASQMQRLDTAMQEIRDSSQKVSQVVKVIDDIAYQTNILAINAAVQAAHVGEHGKGFTVVAREIRSLAIKCADAAKEVSELVHESMAKADDGFAITKETGASIVSIVRDVQESSRTIKKIAEASGQQSAALSEISSGVSQISIVVQRNSLTAEQSAAAAEELTGQADLLNHHLSYFKVAESE